MIKVDKGHIAVYVDATLLLSELAVAIEALKELLMNNCVLSESTARNMIQKSLDLAFMQHEELEAEVEAKKKLLLFLKGLGE